MQIRHATKPSKPYVPGLCHEWRPALAWQPHDPVKLPKTPIPTDCHPQTSSFRAKSLPRLVDYIIDAYCRDWQNLALLGYPNSPPWKPFIRDWRNHVWKSWTPGWHLALPWRTKVPGNFRSVRERKYSFLWHYFSGKYGSFNQFYYFTSLRNTESLKKLHL